MTSDQQQAKTGRWAVAALFGANGLVMGSWAPQIPLLLPRHQIDESTLGLLILGLGIGAVGSMLYSGRLIAAYGSRRVSTLFGLLLVPVPPLVVFAPNLPLLALAMAAMGAVVGCMDVAMNANAVAVEKRLGRAIMSSSHGFWSFGGFVGGAPGGLLLAQYGRLASGDGRARRSGHGFRGRMVRDVRSCGAAGRPTGPEGRLVSPARDPVGTWGDGAVFDDPRRRRAGLGGTVSGG